MIQQCQPQNRFAHGLLVTAIKRDVSAVEAACEIPYLLLYHRSHTFQTISHPGSIIFKKQEYTLCIFLH